MYITGCTFTKDCYNDLLRSYCLNGAIANNNATSCYNCMIQEVTDIHLQGLGLPKKATWCSVQINKQMRHHAKTSHGITTDLYTHRNTYAKYGKGQGETSSPANWIFQSSTILAALHALASGIVLCSTCGWLTSKQTAESYVDNTDCTYCGQTKQQ
eukprot:12733965-Ditylum_brightwellii.AAC.1